MFIDCLMVVEVGCVTCCRSECIGLGKYMLARLKVFLPSSNFVLGMMLNLAQAVMCMPMKTWDNTFDTTPLNEWSQGGSLEDLGKSAMDVITVQEFLQENFH